MNSPKRIILVTHMVAFRYILLLCQLINPSCWIVCSRAFQYILHTVCARKSSRRWRRRRTKRRTKEEGHGNIVYNSDLYNGSINVLYLEFCFIFLSRKMQDKNTEQVILHVPSHLLYEKDAPTKGTQEPAHTISTISLLAGNLNLTFFYHFIFFYS